MKFDTIDLGLTGYDDLFMSSEERADMKKPKVEEIAISELRPFKDHPFRVKKDEEMEQLKKNIHESGVLVPALARPTEDGYELISGHRRMAACAALGLETMPVIVRKLTDEEAVIAMVDSNLQREHLLPSEKAFAYKMKLDALKHQGKASEQLAQKLSVEIVGEASGESKDQVRRYIRLTNLIEPILKLVDEGRIALTPAVELSYLQRFEQIALPHHGAGRGDAVGVPGQAAPPAEPGGKAERREHRGAHLRAQGQPEGIRARALRAAAALLPAERDSQADAGSAAAGHGVLPPAQPDKHGTGGEMIMKKEPKRDDRFIIGLGGGTRIYDIINTRYVVEGRFAEATLTDDDRTLADAVEEIVTSEFTDLTPEEKAPKMKSKPVRTTAGKER